MNNIVSILIVMVGVSLSCAKEKVEQIDYLNCEISDPVSRGSRMVGIDLLDLTESNSFDDNIRHAKDLGIEFIALHLTWTSIEPSSNSYTDPGNALNLLSEIAEENGWKFSLTIRPIDLSGKTVPADIDSKRFNSKEVIDRFKLAVDFIFSRINPDVLLNILIGNEIDAYDTSQEHVEFWNDYAIFLAEVRKHIQSVHPTIKIGFTGTLDGLTNKSSLFNDLLNHVDLLGVTYYPLIGNFEVKHPSNTSADINRLLKKFPNKPVYFQEIGYPTSASNVSETDKQSSFFCEFFQVWDQNVDRIKTANIVRLNDLSMELAEESARTYSIAKKPFIEYLRTLGIRTHDDKGRNKSAFEVIKQNLHVRGW